MAFRIEYPFIFAAGGLIGAGVTWFITRKYYQKIADEEIESVKESFAYLQKDAQEKATAAKNKPPIDLMAQALKIQKANEANVDHSTIDDISDVEVAKVNYSNFSAEESEESNLDKTDISDKDDPDDEQYGVSVKPAEPEMHDGPYILNKMPSANDEPFYTIITLMYYADGTYADSHGVEHEVEDYIGLKLMDYIENTDKDEIVIRNDELQLDIDIVKDARTYDEIMFG